jgi:PIN domain nuclease of toxin-antitoxin system
MSESSLLLDTCAMVWLAAGASELSEQARETINRADRVCVSAISAWEISLKAARGALALPLPPRDWFDRVMDQHCLSLASLSIDILMAANSLPWHHRDPADRFIIATACAMNAPVVTADRRFKQYGVSVVS